VPKQSWQLLTRLSSNEPWDGRAIVALPTSQRMGLENFTMHPETPPLQLVPVRISDQDNTTYALRGSVGDDLSNTPYLTALINPSTHTVSMKIVYLPSPLQASFEANPEACPEGYRCSADQWTFETNSGNGSFVNLGFEGFKGRWVPFKDTRGEGWHLYWKGNAGLHHAVQLDLVPFVG
jgi:hypothetical protein